MKFKLYTLADITPTGARRGAGSPYHQEQNYMTAVQTIGIRTNPLEVNVTSEEKAITKLPFGSKYKGKQRVWCLEFDVDSNGAHSIEMLNEDFNLVPFNNELDETVKFDSSIFVTNSNELCNIFFEVDDK